MRKFFIEDELPSDLGGEFIIDGSEAHHILNVLRLKVGTDIIVTSKKQIGQAVKAEITRLENGQITLKNKEFLANDTEPPIDIYLVQSICKGDKMDYIIQKAIELGVSGIIPVFSEHCTVKYEPAKRDARVVRWQKISLEASKQCGRFFVVPIMPIIDLKDIFSEDFYKQHSSSKKILLYEGQASVGLKEAIRNSNSSSYLLFVGPEGGYSDKEVETFKENSIDIVTLGPRILRAETASLAAISAIMYEHGDLGG
ncbi:16S rRNA (uracil(1498)-N(3))-methyltransferase [Selenomonadales bacterium OttesenSCG-928-I06]|nr:16S rRNA (uracil(1498)-N(3))-methyltransferase [Selenomonadales bacterium OttesenSCG-928-I06]